MPPTARLLALSLVLLAAPMAPAQDRGKATSDVIDDAGMFSREAVRKAKATLDEADRGRDLAVTVETVDSLRGQKIEEVAIRKAEQLGRKGIFILIAKQEHQLDSIASPRAFRDELGKPRLTAINKAFSDEFRKGSVDDGLLKGVQAASAAINEVRHLPVVVGSSAPYPYSPSSSSTTSRQQTLLTLAGARKALAAAGAAAAKDGLKVSIAVVDDGGHLIALDRMDGTAPAAPASAHAKASSAATHRLPTRSYAEPAGRGPVFGGLPIAINGQVVGGIGVAGTAGEQDDKVAQAGIAALMAEPGTAATATAPAEEAKPKPAEESKSKVNEGDKIDITIPRPDEVGKLRPTGDDPR